MRRRTHEQRDRDLTWILVCTNERDSAYPACGSAGKTERASTESDGTNAGGDDACKADVLATTKAWLRERDLFWSRAAVVETSCLGLCSEDGTAVAFQPQNEWFSDVSPTDVAELLDEMIETA